MKPNATPIGFGAIDFPVSREGIAAALRAQREYTLALYAGLPHQFWTPSAFPYMEIVNPPLWETLHIGWFAEFFAVRWRESDKEGIKTPSLAAWADALLDSRSIPHRARWEREYPSRDQGFDYLNGTLERVLATLETCPDAQLDRMRLSIAHEDMHGEALAMTLKVLELPVPEVVPPRQRLTGTGGSLVFSGGTLALGESDRIFRFDNEMPARLVEVDGFEIDTQPVDAEAFAAFRESPAYDDRGIWSAPGWEWRAQHASRAELREGYAALHISYYEAEAFSRWAGRRLPSEAEWEFAATHSAAFRRSCGHVWEWTASPFLPFPGFARGVYDDYSYPWFHDHMVLRGGSFATQPRLRYPQYRNFYKPGRSDVFAGFRTCAL